jgi:lysophospholipase L1-like esterase
MSELVRQLSWLSNFMQRTWVTNLLLTALVVIVPLMLVELALKPFMLKTTIFVQDRELGWKLKPNAEDAWFGVMVKINGKGLRGPELDYRKPSEAMRILYLGDSVPFGYRLKSYDQSFPYRTEAFLEDKLGHQIETINAGVGGYSPWQEHIYFVNEGIKYHPDLVVVSFVINDVIEKFKLKKFGGRHEGVQLYRTVSSTYDWFVRTSSIAYYAREIGARIRFGHDVHRGAQQQEALQVESLVYHADRPDVQRAWQIVLEDLGKIFAFSKENHLPIILVVFPYRFQFKDIHTLAIPQSVVNQYARDHQVPVLDMLPLLDARAKEQGVKPTDYFLDINHLSPMGHQVVAEFLAEFIRREGLVARVP